MARTAKTPTKPAFPDDIKARIDAYAANAHRQQWIQCVLDGDLDGVHQAYVRLYNQNDRAQYPIEVGASQRALFQAQLWDLFGAHVDDWLGYAIEKALRKTPAQLRAAYAYVLEAVPHYGLSPFTLAACHASEAAFGKLLGSLLRPAARSVLFESSWDGIKRPLPRCDVQGGKVWLALSKKEQQDSHFEGVWRRLGDYQQMLLALTTPSAHKVGWIAKILSSTLIESFFERLEESKELSGEAVETSWLGYFLGCPPESIERSIQNLQALLHRQNDLVDAINPALQLDPQTNNYSYWAHDDARMAPLRRLVEQGIRLNTRTPAISYLVQAGQWEALIELLRAVPAIPESLHHETELIRSIPDNVWEQLFEGGIAPYEKPNPSSDFWDEPIGIPFPADEFIRAGRPEALRLCLEHPYAPVSVTVERNGQIYAPLLEVALKNADSRYSGSYWIGALNDTTKALIRVLIERGARLDHTQLDAPQPIRARSLAPEVLAYAQSVEEALTLEGTVQAAPERAPKAPRGL